METKLTLKLDKNVILNAKEYAASQHRSLSGIVEAYLKSLHKIQRADTDKGIQISDFVKSMSGKSDIPNDLDYKAEYSEHLEEKYK